MNLRRDFGGHNAALHNAAPQDESEKRMLGFCLLRNSQAPLYVDPENGLRTAAPPECRFADDSEAQSFANHEPKELYGPSIRA